MQIDKEKLPKSNLSPGTKMSLFRFIRYDTGTVWGTEEQQGSKRKRVSGKD